MDGRCGRGPARRTASAAQYGAGEVDIDVSPACRSGPDRRSGPYPRLDPRAAGSGHLRGARDAAWTDGLRRSPPRARPALRRRLAGSSEEHTSELQSRGRLVCRLLLEKKALIEVVAEMNVMIPKR